MSWQYKAASFSVLTQPGTPSPEALAGVTAQLDELGAEGWEVFAFGEHHGTFWLKRPMTAIFGNWTKPSGANVTA